MPNGIDIFVDGVTVQKYEVETPTKSNSTSSANLKSNMDKCVKVRCVCSNLTNRSKLWGGLRSYGPLPSIDPNSED